MSDINGKVQQTISILMERRNNYGIITCRDLGDQIGTPYYALQEVLDRVNAWATSIKKEPLALLVIEDNGKPGDSMFRFLAKSLTYKITPTNYEQHRLNLWKEDWSTVEIPTSAVIDAAYANY